MNTNRIDRAKMVATVAQCVPLERVSDLPLIRQTANDLADQWRREGWRVKDFAQDSLVKAIQARVRATKGVEA